MKNWLFTDLDGSQTKLDLPHTWNEKMWKSDYGYFELIRILSMGVLLEIEPEYFKELEKKIVDENFNDYFANYLLTHIDNAWQLKSDTFVFPGIYDDLKVMIEREDETTIQLLKEYLSKNGAQIIKMRRGITAIRVNKMCITDIGVMKLVQL